MDFQTQRNKRREARTLVGRFRGGRLAPVLAVPVKGSEGGMVSQSITLRLDPIAGEMLTPITGELISVFVPVQAIDAIKDPSGAYAGMTDVIRNKILSGTPLFGLETEGEISQRLGVVPRSVGGVKKVNEMARLAHNAAVNFLRTRKYVKAAKVLFSNTAVTPALLGQTVLDRLNGVLDPDDRVNGAVALQLPNLLLPVEGLGVLSSNTVVPVAGTVRETGSSGTTSYATSIGAGTGSTLQARVSGTTAATARADVYARLNGTTAGNLSLVDFFQAKRADELVREMEAIIKEHQELGEEQVLRWAHGLSVDDAKVPFVIAERSAQFGRDVVSAMDTAGVNNDTVRSDMSMVLSFTVPVPRTELGGVIITFATLKPDETLASQPHPILADVWGAENMVADELTVDPQPVTMRELDSEIASALEATVAFYTGLNELKRAYIQYGFARNLNQTTVAAKTAIWQYPIPMSVTPESILYPADISHYPFQDQAAEVCTYSVTSMATFGTPMPFGPTPVETIAQITTSNLFEGQV